MQLIRPTVMTVDEHVRDGLRRARRDTLRRLLFGSRPLTRNECLRRMRLGTIRSLATQDANSPYTLFSTQAAGPSLTAGTAASMLIAAAPAAGQIRNTIPAGWLNAVGTTFTLEASGTLATAATPGTGTWSLNFGATAIWNSTAITLTASMTTWPWFVHLDFRVTNVGATTAATLYGTGWLGLATAANASSLIQFTPGAGASGFDSTVPNVCDLWFTESLTTATLVCQYARCVIWNPAY